MRRLCLVLAVVLPALLHTSTAFAVNQSPAGWRVTPVSSLHKLTASAQGVLEPFAATPVQLRAARGEWESFQLVITAGDAPLHAVEATATGLATHLGEYIAPANIQLFRENYVFVDKPSCNRRLEKLWWPDALIPLDLQAPPDVPARRSIVLWIAVRTPPEAQPGQYYGALDITANGEKKQLAVALKVEPVTLPPPSMRANVAVYYDAVRAWYANNWKPLSDDEFARLKRQYYEFLLDYRINAYDLPVPWNSPEADRYLTDPRVLSVRLPPLDHPDFADAVAAFRRNAVLAKAYYYWIDEPASERYDEIRAVTNKLHAVDPLLKHSVTVHPNRALDGAVDIWCPNIGDYFGLGHLDLARLAAERRKGKETWWYTMVEPKYPYPTWLLDDDASAVRIYGWMMARYSMNGFVYSMAHGWGPKPLENLQSFAGTNGDGTLLYPSEIGGGSGPMPSVRLMLLRDAIEDYELLRLLPAARRIAVAGSTLDAAAPLLFPAAKRQAAQWQKSRDALFSSLAGKFLPTPLISIKARHSLILRRMRPVAIDGHIKEATWNSHSRHHGLFKRWPDDADTTLKTNPSTALWTGHDGTNLLVAIRAGFAPALSKGEWLAVEIAPVAGTERWRFVVTPDGKAVAEKHTREGRFRIEGVNWKFATEMNRTNYEVEMQIPLSVVGANTFRF
ncbi:MAG TPA: glycoside hydrolase domain-containing protein, partial [Abditibacteriaceae bacterium]|nr:glycoside hydrolase domain-containing protein [Abditibacteriaceae bacterium]